MKNNINLILSLFVLILVVVSSQELNGQELCSDTPSNISDFKNCNRLIAMTFAPKLVQFVSDCLDGSEDGNSDRITKVNWDNDWDATNNWQSVEEYSENNTVSKVRGITPIVVLAMHLSTKKRFRAASQPIATERFGLIMTELLK